MVHLPYSCKEPTPYSPVHSTAMSNTHLDSIPGLEHPTRGTPGSMGLDNKLPKFGQQGGIEPSTTMPMIESSLQKNEKDNKMIGSINNTNGTPII